MDGAFYAACTAGGYTIPILGKLGEKMSDFIIALLTKPEIQTYKAHSYF